MALNRIEIEVLRGQSALAGFRQTWRWASGGDFGPSRLAFGTLAQLFTEIMEKRLELVRHVATHGGLNARKLATELNRDYKNVYADVRALTDLGLLEKDERGLLLAPFDERSSSETPD
jgi:predicted transcriptional regulator